MTQTLRLLVGLGNPGVSYQGTRHNAGARWLESLARHCHANLQMDKRFFGRVARATVSGHDVRLLIPETYMNRSGQAVAATATYFKIAPEEILVAHDELDLPTGIVRLKQGGGHGGHNGLRSIIQSLGNERGFARLRLGIGHPGSASDVTGHVLSRPSDAEDQALQAAISAALDETDSIVRGELNTAMNRLHRFSAT